MSGVYPESRPGTVPGIRHGPPLSDSTLVTLRGYPREQQSLAVSRRVLPCLLCGHDRDRAARLAVSGAEDREDRPRAFWAALAFVFLAGLFLLCPGVTPA
jgi:hypothetical protein